MKQKVYKNVIFDTHVWAQYTAKFVFVALFLFFVFLLVYFFTPLIGVMLHRVGLHTRSTAIGLLFTSVTAACQITITF